MTTLAQKIPRGSITLFFAQIFSTMAFAVFYSSLVLFAVQGLHLSAVRANSIIATFVSFNFALHLIGGFLGGRLLSFRLLFVIGMILQAAGSILISTVNVHLLYIGMAVFLTGSGMNVPCMNCMLAQLFEPEDKRRETAFLWNYAGMNVGFFIGFTIAGIYQMSRSFHALFFMTSFSSVIAALIMLIGWKQLKDIKTQLTEATVSHFSRGITGLIAIAVLIFALCFILIHAGLSSEIVMGFGVFMAVVIAVIAFTRKIKAERHHLFAYYIFAIASLTFFTLYQLCPMALTLFLERNVDRHLLGFNIPTEWFLNIDSVIVIVGCPLFAHFIHSLRKKGHNVSIPFLFSIGLLLIGIAIALVSVGIHFSNAKGLTNAGWIILSYTLLAIGEISLSPIGYAVVGQLAPPKLRGVMMGTWLMLVGVAATLSKLFSNIALGKQQAISPLISNATYSSTFLHLGLASIAVGIVLLLLKPLIARLMDSL